MFRCVLSGLLMALLCISSAYPTAPSPQLLEKIKAGKTPIPQFISDPSYRGRFGIDQGLGKPLFDPKISLVNANFLAVLVGFQDRSGITPSSYFDSLVFGTFPGPWGPTLRDFYRRASYGNFNIVTVNLPSITGWQNAPNNRRYYTARGGTYSYGLGAYPYNSQGLCEWVIAAIDPIINFANYDNDGDGAVDGIILIHAGSGAEVSGDTLDIWSHAWNINPQNRDGVFISSYCIVPELWNSPQDMTVGVYCHEFGHILGLPDLYDYGNDSYGLGQWSLMAYGNWNGNTWGMSPAFLDAYSRVFLGYVTPVNVTCYINNQMIYAVEDSAVVFRLWNHGNVGSEYFLVENRYRTYTDTALAYEGITIYHIDENQADNNSQWWPGQPPANHYKVALEQADGLWNLEQMNNPMDVGDPYPGLTFNRFFDSSSVPSSRDYYNNATNVSITDLAGGPLGWADLDVGSTAPPGIPVSLYPPDGTAFNTNYLGGSWAVTPCATRYWIQMDNDNNFSSPIVNDSTLVYPGAQYSFLHQPDGIYYWHVRAGNSAGWSGWSETRSEFLDRQAPFGTIASSPDTAHSSSFLVSWNAANDPAPSSGICYYVVWCDSGAGPAWGWLGGVDTLSYTFTSARSGNTYSFTAAAFDCATNNELWSFPPYECSTYVEYQGFSYVAGDANGNGTFNGIDVTYSVNYLKGIGGAPPDYLDCPGHGMLYAAADANGNCQYNGIDVTYSVNYLKGQGQSPRGCVDCPPAR